MLQTLTAARLWDPLQDEAGMNSTHLRNNATCQALNAAQMNGADSWSLPR